MMMMMIIIIVIIIIIMIIIVSLRYMSILRLGRPISDIVNIRHRHIHHWAASYTTDHFLSGTGISSLEVRQLLSTNYRPILIYVPDTVLGRRSPLQTHTHTHTQICRTLARCVQKLHDLSASEKNSDLISELWLALNVDFLKFTVSVQHCLPLNKIG